MPFKSFVDEKGSVVEGNDIISWNIASSKNNPVDVMVIADFEAYQMEVDRPHAKGQMKVHMPSGFALKLVSFSDYVKPRYYIYKGGGAPDDVMEKFFLKLKKWYKKISKIQREDKKMHLTETKQTAFEKSGICYICDKPFTNKDIKV